MRLRRVLSSLTMRSALTALMLLSALPALAQEPSSTDAQPSPRPGVALPPDFDFSRFRRENQAFPDTGVASGQQSAEGPGTPEFTWLRGRYENYPGGRGRRGGWWDTDFPDAEQNFMRGVQRYTFIDAQTYNTRWIDLTDPELFEHIFLYMTMKRVPIGGMSSGPNFSADEVAALREFALRGGFVMLDDFWGEAHYQDFLIEIAKIFPDRELVRLDLDHEIFGIFYDIDQVAQVPGRAVTWDYGSVTLDDPRYPPSVHAILDDAGRVMVVASFNSDMGDGWEHTFHEYYPTSMSNEAYRLGINYLIYAYTH
ncbi:DUF4159 domain-containing protein [Pseudohongiella sp.]|uniref:DUF4159 domain-containing protein n=1 Tax=marine sediment metagenome TaxID=412755 RepID=A0A0F9W6D8_9ZZZZ|nr:DUF4159 domain-containing protein [Pseudohongiella sp.]HDZ08095.1 DUF4159 domain-containing protein [Pseudohongiella sp.]HEA63063.1 DUF4159 domain-containing protein [Pseudohongiella sp.]